MKKAFLIHLTGLIFGLFSFSAFADFSVEPQGLWCLTSGCNGSLPFNDACSNDSCGDNNSSPADILCPGSDQSCPTGKGKYVWPYNGNSLIGCPTYSTRVGDTATCTCNQGTYQNTTTGLISINTSCTPNYATPSNDILAYAIGAGLMTGGLATSFAACATTVAASPVCVAGILAAAAGAGLALSAYNSSSDTSPMTPSPDPCAGKNCVSVQLDADKPLTGSGDSVSKDVFGNVKANGSGFTNNGDGTFTKTSTNDDGSTTTTFVDELNDRITSTTTTNTGSYSSALQFGLDSNGFPTVSQVSQWTDTAGTTTYQQQGSYDQNGVISSQSQASQGTGGYGGTTGDTGGGGETGGGGADSNAVDAGITDCEEYGCAKEVTQLKVLDSLKGGGELDHAAAAQSALDSVTYGLSDDLEDYTKQINDAINDILNDSGIRDALDQLGDYSPLNFDASDCSISSNWMGHQLDLSYCDEQETIHWALSFIFFVLFSFAIINVLLEKNH
jgi:hypothetical protein